MPMLAVIAPAMEAGLHGPRWLVWLLMIFSLALFGWGLTVSLARHHHWGPAVISAAAAVLLVVVETTTWLPKAAGFASGALLLVAWVWDRKLSKEGGHGHCAR